MMVPQAVSTTILVGLLAGGVQADQVETPLQGGAYQITVRVELPNVENWAAQKTTTICLPIAGGTSNAPLPVLSDNNPLANCPAMNVQRNGTALTFDIVCDGRNTAKARAVYTIMPQEFQGRIAMVMGGKNMTMTEVQVGHRLGRCDLPGAPQD